MMLPQLILISAVIFELVQASPPKMPETCEFYKQFTPEHSFCRPKSRTCNFTKSGVDAKEQDLIVKLHNDFRRIVAIGNETGAKGLPQASNMMAMVWDYELAAIAQKWVDTCSFGSDCPECRQVERFPVGQNWVKTYSGCHNTTSCMTKNITTKWSDAVSSFHGDVSEWNKNLISSFRTTRRTAYFTQMIWAETWRIGCGYAGYLDGYSFKEDFVCNYGPAGNVPGHPVYQVGESCSNCPLNSCCGGGCRGQKTMYPGLCQMKDNNAVPKYPITFTTFSTKDFFFNCDFASGNPDCDRRYTGSGRWRHQTQITESGASLVLKGGRTNTVDFNTELKPTTVFCLRITYKKGPSVLGKEDSSSLTMHFGRPGFIPKNMQLPPTYGEFQTTVFDIGWRLKTEIGITFQVPKDAVNHYLHIKHIKAFNGRCSCREITE